MSQENNSISYAKTFINELYQSGICDFKPKALPKNFGEVIVLFTLNIKGPINSGELASCLSMKTARIAAILKALEEKGQITRTQRKEDKRIIIVSLTEKGKESCINTVNDLVKRIANAYEKIGREEMDQFKSTLIKLCLIAKEEAENA